MGLSLIVIILAFVSSSLFAMENKQDNFCEIGSGLKLKPASLYEKCDESVFLGSAEVNGISVFLGMEKIDTSIDKQNWLRYRDYALGVEQLYQYLSQSITEKKKISLDDETWDGYSLKELTGFSSEDEFQQYLLSFEKFMQDKRSLKIATHIEKGAHGFLQIMNIGCYVVYASKIKVSGKYPFPKDFGSISPLSALQTYFNDLIMTVCSRDYCEDENKDIASFENRGIFKNPITCYYDGNTFSGLSLKLHGLSACVRKSFSSKEYMYVGAAYGMTKVLVNFDGWQKGDFILNYKDFVECTEEEKKPGIGDTPCLIKIDALIQIFQR